MLRETGDDFADDFKCVWSSAWQRVVKGQQPVGLAKCGNRHVDLVQRDRAGIGINCAPILRADEVDQLPHRTKLLELSHQSREYVAVHAIERFLKALAMPGAPDAHLCEHVLGFPFVPRGGTLSCHDCLSSIATG